VVPLPVVLGLIVCEKAIVEEGTKNVTLVSTYSRLVVEEFPSRPQKFVVHSLLTEGLGECTIDLLVRKLETDEEVYHATLPVRFPDRLMEVCVLFRVSRCVFPSPGTYEFALLLDGEWLAQRRIQLVEKET
jgi:hypothetical protein